MTLFCDDKQIGPHKVISRSTGLDISYLNVKVEEINPVDVKHLDDEGPGNTNFGPNDYYYEYGVKKLKNKAQLKIKFPGFKSENKFSCNHCPKKFKEKATLKIHIQSHEYTFACKLCSKLFTQPREFMFQLQIQNFKDQPLLEVDNKIFKLGVKDQNFIHQVF